MVPWTFWTLLSLYVVGRFIRPVCALHMHDWTPMPGRSPNPRIRPVPRHLDGIGCIKKVTTKGVGVLHRSPKIATPSTLWCHRGKGATEHLHTFIRVSGATGRSVSIAELLQLISKIRSENRTARGGSGPENARLGIGRPSEARLWMLK